MAVLAVRPTCRQEFLRTDRLPSLPRVPGDAIPLCGYGARKEEFPGAGTRADAHIGMGRPWASRSSVANRGFYATARTHLRLALAGRRPERALS